MIHCLSDPRDETSVTSPKVWTGVHNLKSSSIQRAKKALQEHVTKHRLTLFSWGPKANIFSEVEPDDWRNRELSVSDPDLSLVAGALQWWEECVMGDKFDKVTDEDREVWGEIEGASECRLKMRNFIRGEKQWKNPAGEKRLNEIFRFRRTRIFKGSDWPSHDKSKCVEICESHCYVALKALGYVDLEPDSDENPYFYTSNFGVVEPRFVAEGTEDGEESDDSGEGQEYGTKRQRR